MKKSKLKFLIKENRALRVENSKLVQQLKTHDRLYAEKACRRCVKTSRRGLPLLLKLSALLSEQDISKSPGKYIIEAGITPLSESEVYTAGRVENETCSKMPGNIRETPTKNSAEFGDCTSTRGELEVQGKPECHQRLRKSQSEASKQRKPVSCGFESCSFRSSKREELDIHQRRFHGEPMHSSPVPSGGLRRFRCGFEACLYTTIHQLKLLAHENIHRKTNHVNI